MLMPTSCLFFRLLGFEADLLYNGLINVGVFMGNEVSHIVSCLDYFF